MGQGVSIVRFPEKKLPSESIVVLRAHNLRGLMAAVPAFRALRKEHPLASISLIGLPPAKEFVTRFSHLIDEFIEFPGFPGVGESVFDPGQVLHFIKAMQSRRFSLAIQLHGPGNHLNELVSLMGADAIAGFYPEGGWCPDVRHFFKYPQNASDVMVPLHLMRQLGYELSESPEIEFPLYEFDRKRFSRSLGEMNSVERYICIHPGSGSVRPWPVSHFVKAAKALANDSFTIVVTGSREEAFLAEFFKAELDNRVVDLCGKTDLGLLGCVIESSDLLISNDTGVAYVAEALGRPAVIVHSDCSREARRPAVPELHRLIESPNIPPSLVIEEARTLLASTIPRKQPSRLTHATQSLASVASV